jgi:hypothetical protein
MVHARRLAIHSKSELVEHGKDGRIRDSASFSRDPHPPRDRDHVSRTTSHAIPKGFGALGDKFSVRRDVDISKPIYEQVSRNLKSHRSK